MLFLRFRHHELIPWLLDHQAHVVKSLDCFSQVLKQRSISGSAVGGRKGFREMLRIVSLHNIRPMCEIMPLKDVNKAFDKLANGSPHYRCDHRGSCVLSRQSWHALL